MNTEPMVFLIYMSVTCLDWFPAYLCRIPRLAFFYRTAPIIQRRNSFGISIHFMFCFLYKLGREKTKQKKKHGVESDFIITYGSFSYVCTGN